MGAAPGRSTAPHLLFQVVARKPKTVVVAVIERRSDEVIGEVAWYGAFRAYCFMPTENTVWSTGCLDEVRAEIARLMRERRAAREETT